MSNERPRGVLGELLRHNEWARDVLLAAAAGLDDAALDRPFEMGPGSIRGTFQHLWAAEQLWLERWMGAPQPQWRGSEAGVALPELRSRFEQTHRERAGFLAAAREAGLSRRVAYRNLKGEPFEQPLGDLVLHVSNHGVHHRAQIANMLRQVGLKPPGLDYLYMRAAFPTLAQDEATRAGMAQLGFGPIAATGEPAAFEPDTIAEYFRFSDWATGRVLAEAEQLSDAELDRPFEMGLGSLRKTLLHIRDAEDWWCDNWEKPGSWNPLPATTTPAELKRLLAATVQRRDAFISAQTPESLQRETAAEVRPGLFLKFRIGESLLQLPPHGTHHRAQALNMLRQLGRPAPALDYVIWMREAMNAVR